MNKIRLFLKKQRYAIAAFFFPVLITTIAFAITGIYPFGANQITVIDMYHQYVPFLSELQYKLQHGGSLFYSWDGAGGFNFWNLLSYYCASPLNLILILFPAGFVVEGVTLILLLKIGFAGCFMYLFLTCRYGKDCSVWMRSESAGAWSRVALGSLYALCAFTCGYFWCIMWIDVVALLPLIILGLTRLVDEGKGILYAVSLGLACFCNYYIAMMVCIFIVLYYLMYYFSRPRPDRVIGFLIVTFRTAAYSCIGAALAAPMLIPTYISMKNTYYTPTSLPEEWNFYHDPIEVVNQMLPLAHLSYRDGLPNICAGLLVCMLLVCYFVSRMVPLREKAAHGLLLLALFCSLNVNVLDFLWHGCHYPNELPFRWSFAVSFVLVSMACRAMSRMPQIKMNTLWAIFAGGLGYYLIVSRLLKDTEAIDEPDEFFYIGVGLLIIYTALLVVWRKGWLAPRGVSLLILLVVGGELLCSVALGFDKVGNVERDPYLEHREEIAEIVNQTKSELVRTELYDWSIMNTPALFHYRGLSQFSSSLNSHATELMEKIGLEGEPGKNRYNYVVSDPVTNAMLSLKYIIATDEIMNDDNFRRTTEAGDSTLYESNYPLSIGYMLPESIRTWDLISTDPFAVLDDYVRAATDNRVKGVFQKAGQPEADGFEASVNAEGDGIFTAYSDDGASGMAHLTYTALKDGNHYVYVEADQAESIDVVYGDGDVRSLREDCGAIVSLGKLQKGDDFTVEINFEIDGGGTIRCHVCTIDQEAWDRAYTLISREQMNVTSFGDTFIEGTIHADRDGVFTTSVNYENGWKIRVDGEKRLIEDPVGGNFIAVPLTAGDHTIRLSFRPPGFIGGCVLLILAVLLLLLDRWYRRRRMAKMETAEAKAGSFPTSDTGEMISDPAAVPGTVEEMLELELPDADPEIQTEPAAASADPGAVPFAAPESGDTGEAVSFSRDGSDGPDTFRWSPSESDYNIEAEDPAKD